MDAIDAKQALLDELSQMQENNSAIEQKKEEISTKKFALEERRVNAEYDGIGFHFCCVSLIASL